MNGVRSVRMNCGYQEECLLLHDCSVLFPQTIARILCFQNPVEENARPDEGGQFIRLSK